MFGKETDLKVAFFGIIFFTICLIAEGLRYDTLPNDEASVSFITTNTVTNDISNYTPPNPEKYLMEEMVKVDVEPLPLPKKKSFLSSLVEKYQDIDKRELIALTVAIYCESRGETLYGIKAVADTIRNRVKSPHFPNNYFDVVTQPHQFSCITDRQHLENNIRIYGQSDVAILTKIVKIAARTIRGDMPRMTYNALFYHTVETKPYWSKKYSKLGVVGNHIFYTTNKL